MNSRTRRRATLTVALALALVTLGFLVYVTNPIVLPQPAQAAGTGQHTQCKGRSIHVFHDLIICKQTDYMLQPDGHGIWVIATTIRAVKGCGLLEDTGGRFTSVTVTTMHTSFPYWPVAQKRLGTQYRCSKTKAVGIPGPGSGPARVGTSVHARIDNANDWNMMFTEELRRP